MDPEKEPSFEGEKAQYKPEDHRVPPGNDDFDLSAPVMEELRGSRLGNVRVRIVRPQHLTFRRTKEGVLVATERASTPEGRFARSIATLKRVLIGPPLATAMAEQERLTKVKALAVLSSDAISSVAYATEAILINLVAAGSLSLGLTFPISLVIIALLFPIVRRFPPTLVEVDHTLWRRRTWARSPD